MAASCAWRPARSIASACPRAGRPSRPPSAADNRRRYELHRARLLAAARERAQLLAERKRSAHPVAMTPQHVRQIFSHLQQDNPHPRSELLFDSPFELLIAVILSAQATDKGVNLATRELFRQAPTPAAMLKLGLAGLKRHIRTIGLYNAKARNIIATCRQLIEHHGGEVPARSRVARAIAWSRPQDSQCGAQHRFR